VKRWFLFVVLFALGTVQAKAQDHTIKGVGASTCGEFASQYGQNPSATELVYFSWAQGFMTGRNVGALAGHGNAKGLDSIPFDDQQRAVRDYCNGHPGMEKQRSLVSAFSGSMPRS
jgi:hypothetical protein